MRIPWDLYHADFAGVKAQTHHVPQTGAVCSVPCDHVPHASHAHVIWHVFSARSSAAIQDRHCAIVIGMQVVPAQYVHLICRASDATP